MSADGLEWMVDARIVAELLRMFGDAGVSARHQPAYGAQLAGGATVREAKLAIALLELGCPAEQLDETTLAYLAAAATRDVVVEALTDAPPTWRADA